MSEGVSNIEIEKLIEKSDNDLKKKFVEVVFSNNISHFCKISQFDKKNIQNILF